MRAAVLIDTVRAITARLTAMSTPTPAQLRGYAHRLRELAATQRTRATTVETLIEHVTKLDDAQTWSGTYPDTAHAAFQAWVTGLRDSGDQIRSSASSWSTLADDRDAQAAKAAKAG